MSPILNLRLPVLADWQPPPLQEELFGTQFAGEIFFQNLQRSMGRNILTDGRRLRTVRSCVLLLVRGPLQYQSERGELRSSPCLVI